MISTTERRSWESANVSIANGSGRALTIKAPTSAKISVESSSVAPLAARTPRPNRVIAIA